MAIPHISLSAGEHHLLAELSLAPLASSDRSGERAAARGIDLDHQRADLASLLVKGLVHEDADSLETTALGEAILLRAENEATTARLADLVAFAEALVARNHPDAPIMRALAEGAIDLREALVAAGVEESSGH
ncbi:hypothetical protein LO772_08070 [Yinghuangia sp. ASG 101]|uniref:hypothetical protein n=1 Tax=Yinghuangia sp. ASG 101 TaxID=2896848 RepID=UPI001E595645|nr:hypothetical protein [Yinghuangia sp. ASG 101]UGQ13550.1 hypothetical protein LO772_08070 [Yinghuangia sp. ASG 101]